MHLTQQPYQSENKSKSLVERFLRYEEVQIKDFDIRDNGFERAIVNILVDDNGSLSLTSKESLIAYWRASY